VLLQGIHGFVYASDLQRLLGVDAESQQWCAPAAKALRVQLRRPRVAAALVLMGICHHSQREITAQEPSELSHKVVIDSHIGVYVVDGHVARQGEQVSNPLYVLHRRPCFIQFYKNN